MTENEISPCLRVLVIASWGLDFVEIMGRLKTPYNEIKLDLLFD